MNLIIVLSASLFFQPAFPNLDEPLSETLFHQPYSEYEQVYDAVILEDRTDIRADTIYRYRKIHVFSDAGKEAAVLSDEERLVRRLRGRVVDADGKETRFNHREDFVAVLVNRIGRDQKKKRILVPPGMSRNCIVEYRWEIPAEYGIPRDHYGLRYFVQEPWHVKEKVFYIDQDAKPEGIIFWGTQFVWTDIQEPAHMDHGQDGRLEIIRYTDVPPLERHPFGNIHRDDRAAFLSSFRNIASFSKEHDLFWQQFARDYYRKVTLIAKPGKTKEYKAFIKELRGSLPKDRKQALLFIYNRFQESIDHIDTVPPERRAQAYAILKENRDDITIGTIFNRGIGTSNELSRLFFHILDDTGLNCDIILANRTDNAPLRIEEMNIFSFSGSVPLFGIEEQPGRWFLVAPGSPHYPPGYVPPEYQGTKALVMDMGNQFKTRWSTIPRFPAQAHQKIRVYQVLVEAEGNTTFQIQVDSGGWWESQNRAFYKSMLPEERDEALRKLWSKRRKDWLVVAAKVEGAETSTQAIRETVTAVRPAPEIEANFISLNPFPGSQAPFDLPEYWPQSCRQPLVLPFASTVTDYAAIAVPPGYHLMGNPSWQKENEIGKVVVNATEKDGRTVVRRDIVLKADVVGPEQVKDLKMLCSWIDEAMNQDFGFKKADP